MQLTFSCVPQTQVALEEALSAARLGRYLASAKGDKHHGLRLYVWNSRLCEALYLPTQICEVAVRNAVHGALRAKFGSEWYAQGAFLCTLPERLKSDLRAALRDERDAYGPSMTIDHVVSALSFGFWVHLLTKNYESVLWPKCFRTSFPHKPRNISRQAVHQSIDQLRILRNRIAHHKPVFDRRPSAEFQNILILLSWICPETRWFVVATSRVAQIVAERPAF